MNNISKSAAIIIILLGMILPAYADDAHPVGIKLDGTLGSAGKLDLLGPDYDIKAAFGKQTGTNLFHSFGQFNLHKGESATFTGPGSVRNIISRVTGGNASWIDGKLGSSIPNADLYFLNPAGLMFGANASLDLSGSFHVSTADYLRLGENERFYAMPQANEVLSSASPAAFGFLDDSISKISLEGKGEITEQEAADNPAGLRVSEGKTISLVGGDVEIGKGTYYKVQQVDKNGNPVVDKDGNPVMDTKYQPSLSAPAGRINLAGAASEGEVVPRDSDLSVSSAQKGNITLSGKALIDAGGKGGGSVYVRGGQFVADNSTVSAKTTGADDGRVIDIQADTVSLNKGSVINADTDSSGKGADVRITASGLAEFNDKSYVYARTNSKDAGAGNSGNIQIEAKDISIQKSIIYGDTYGPGKGGDVTLKAQESIVFGTEDSTADSRVSVQTYSEKDGAGNAGTASAEAKNISFYTASSIYANTLGAGRGGDIILKAEDTISFQGQNSRLFARTESMAENAGRGGDVIMEAENIIFRLRGGISAQTYGAGDTGNIILRAGELVSLSEILVSKKYACYLTVSTKEGATGTAGNITIETKDLVLADGSYLSTLSSGSGNSGEINVKASGKVSIYGADMRGWASGLYANAAGSKNSPGGDAGKISVEAAELVLNDGGLIVVSTQAGNEATAGKGGRVNINVSGNVSISGVNPYGENETGFASGIYARVRGAGDNTGDGDEISLTAGSLTIEQGGVIENSTNSNADSGNISITVKDGVRISGDSSGISLKEPSELQLDYLTKFSPEKYNQSVSGIYATSTGRDINSGKGGTIDLKAGSLILSDKGAISTSGAGGGKAGDIILNVDYLEINAGSSVSSESLYLNAYNFADIAERDNRFLVTGDVIEIADIGDGTAARYVNIGTTQIRVLPVLTVANADELKGLVKSHAIWTGDIVTVADAGDGQPARFIYNVSRADEWVKLIEDQPLNFPDMNALKEITVPDKTVYPDTVPTPGTLIHVADAGDGKPADFVFVTDKYIVNNVYQNRVFGHALRVNSFSLSDAEALNRFTTATNLSNGAFATVQEGGASVNYVFNNGEWIRFNKVYEAENIVAMNRLVSIQTGNIANIAAGKDGSAEKLIYSGKEWMPVNRIYTVADSAEKDRLTPEKGDVVRVADAGDGISQDYLYADGQWIKTVRGGNAGTITVAAGTIAITNRGLINTSSSGNGKAGDTTLTAKQLTLENGGSVSSTGNQPELGGDAGTVTIAADNVRLTDAAITTEAKGGGGGKINVNAGNTVYLHKGEVTSSVKQGYGKGGDVSADSKFVILNKGNIRANAEEGDGGAVFIKSENFLKSSDSRVEATSARGNQGTVEIQAPDVDISGSLTVMPGTFIDAAGMLPRSCKERTAEDVSRFVITGRDATPTPADDLQASPPEPFRASER